MRPKIAACVEWELTSRCDLECVHCYARRGRPRGADLDRSETASIARRLADLGCRSVTLSGGEPTLCGDWPRIAESLGRRGVGVQMVSNGQAIRAAQAREARDAGVRLVLLSLDGLERSHDRIRRKRGSFGRVLAAAEALRASDVTIGFLTTVLGWNADDLEAMEPVVSGLGPALWQVWLAIPQPGAGPWPGRGLSRGLAPRIERLAGRCPAIAAGDNVPSTLRRTAGRRFECGAGRIVMGLRSDGAVKGCLALPGAGIRGPLEQAWSRCAPAGRSRTCRAMALAHGGAGAVRRSAAAVAASAAVVSSLAAGCGPRPEEPREPEPAPVVVPPQPRTEDREPSEPAPPGPSLVEAQCTCVSEQKNPDGTPVSTSPCICVSHMICTATSGMWLCPEGHERQISAAPSED